MAELTGSSAARVAERASFGAALEAAAGRAPRRAAPDREFWSLATCEGPRAGLPKTLSFGPPSAYILVHGNIPQ
jgi:hypothetical protein